VSDYRTFEPARVLLVDRADRILLFEDTDPGLPGTRWWITPGGGIEEGESALQAAVRELREETGAVVAAGELAGPLARRTVRHGYSDVVVVQEEVFFAVVVAPFELDVSGHTAEERLTMTRHRWWTREELSATTEEVWPSSLLSLWERFDRRAPLVELGEQEESTVPVVQGH
jgi:8-oxo-dGTP pyrophosphatase MutT (NUDIX family)